jgi:uncharacterized protein
MTSASPCINVCRMHPALALCEGCGRSLDEIAAWGRLSDADKDRIWRALPDRWDQLQRAGVTLHRERAARP